MELPTRGTMKKLPFVQLDGPYGIAVDTQGDVYVSNFDR